MRRLLHHTLLGTLADPPVGGRVYARGSLGTGAGASSIQPWPDKPFVLHREIRDLPAPGRFDTHTSRVRTRNFEIFVYDERGSYSRIEDIIETFRPVLMQLEGLQSTSGHFCMGVSWGGVSEDFTDEQYEAFAKYATVSLTESA